MIYIARQILSEWSDQGRDVCAGETSVELWQPQGAWLMNLRVS
jgi:hypothetical protein